MNSKNLEKQSTPKTIREQAQMLVDTYGCAKDGFQREAIIESIASENLVVVEELFKMIIEQQQWIMDVRDILKRGG